MASGWPCYGGGFDVERKTARLEEIGALETQEDFWTDAQKARGITKEKSVLAAVLDRLKRAESVYGDLEVMREMLAEDPSEENRTEAGTLLASLQSEVRTMEIAEMLSGPNDNAAAIVNINAGAGGTEAQDWASMLLRMYLRYCEDRGYKVQVLDSLQGEEAGIKSATFLAQGPFAYGMCR